MKHQNRLPIAGRALLVALLIGLLFSASVPAQEKPTVASKLEEALALYLPPEYDYEKGIAIAGKLLERDDLTAQDSVGIFSVLSLLTYVKGDDYHRQAFAYLDRIANVGPCVIHLPQEIWPSELRQKWYQVANANDQLVCQQVSQSDIKTIAIMEFDNFSIGEYQEKLGPLGKGLADFFEHDFGKISAMHVVERDKINYVLKEHELQQSGAVDKSTAVQAGKILGAKFMVFGSITQLDDRNTRMVVRVVDVETSEIIASVDKEGRPQYTKLEKELVEELAGKLDVQLSDDAKKLIEEGGTASLDATAYYAKGLEYMDRYDYKNAYEYFKKAYDLDNNFTEAERKMNIYQPLAS